jgi:hypothetical protein
MPYSTISSLEPDRALRRLAELATAAHLTIELVLCHNAVMMVVYGAAASTGEAAKIPESSTRGEALVRQVAIEQELPFGWLEGDTRFFFDLANSSPGRNARMFGPNLILSVGAPDRLLATKLHACQQASPPSATDITDLRFLVDNMRLVSSEPIDHLYARFYPGGALSEGIQLLADRRFGPRSERHAC